MNTKYSQFFRSSDFEKALVLRSAGAILQGLEWSGTGETAYFLFEDENSCLEILDKHRRKKLALNSVDVLGAYHELKAELYGRR